MNNKMHSKTRLAAAKYLLAGLLAGVLSTQAPLAAAEVAPISTQGNKVLFGGKPGSVAGNSLFWSNNGWGGEKYYTAGTVGWLKSDWNSKLVRAAMGVEEAGGYLADPAGNKAKVKTVVDAAIANDIYVIIDWHTHHAEQYTSQSVAFFQDMARTYGQYNNVIYEVYNEPLDTASWSGVIKPYAQTLVNAIRAIDPDNLIIVGTRTWSQRVDEASRDPLSGANIAYTLHFYAGSHGQYVRDYAQTALNNNVPIFVTEWGSVNANGDGGVAASETWAWADFMKTNNISHANWALNDKAEGSSALVSGASGNGGWTSNQLTASGALAKDIISNWPPLTGGSNPGTGTCVETGLNTLIQAEDYCRMSGIQTESTSDSGGGKNVGWIDLNDWMTYSINVPSAGNYKVSYRVASKTESGYIQLESAGGANTYGTLQFAATGDWQAWTTVTHTVSLPAGKQTIGIKALSGGWNINWIKIEATGTSSSSSSSSSSGTTTPIATVQAESYSYMSGIQTEGTSDTGGGLNVGWIDAGDWLSYVNTPVNIPTAGTYEIEYRVASQSGTHSLNLEEAGGAVYGTINFPATGGWQTWTTVKHRVSLPAGARKFGLKANSTGFNINWFRISKVN